MKKLILLTLGVTFGTISMAYAGDYHAKRTDSGHDRTNVYITSQDDISMRTATPMNRTVNLADGGTLQIRGKSAYLVNADGYRYFAPDASYVSTNGVSYVTEEGLLIRTEDAPTTSLLRADTYDHNRNGVVDDVDLNVRRVK